MHVSCIRHLNLSQVGWYYGDKTSPLTGEQNCRDAFSKPDWADFVHGEKDVLKESGERYYCASIEDATCCLFLLFMCVYMYP
jgi:hypothetical protein